MCWEWQITPSLGRGRIYRSSRRAAFRPVPRTTGAMVTLAARLLDEGDLVASALLRGIQGGIGALDEVVGAFPRNSECNPDAE